MVDEFLGFGRVCQIGLSQFVLGFRFQQDCRAFFRLSSSYSKARAGPPAATPAAHPPGEGACACFAALYPFEGFPFFGLFQAVASASSILR
jgi:hypothetical protein